MWSRFLIFVFTLSRLHTVTGECSKRDYQYCVRLADPLLKDPQLIYPDKREDIDHVCRTWSLFVDCVKKYTERCFTEFRRQEFNKAVESPVDTIHHMCTDPLYQNEYLKHASCMKATLTKDSHCGRHYRNLAAQVSGDAGRVAICCSHHRFRECVLDRTRNTCDPDAGPFSRQILDKSLSFLKDQCINYEPNRADCPGADFYTPQVRTDNPARANTKTMFDSEVKTTSFQSDNPTWFGDTPSTKGTGMGGSTSSQNPEWLGNSPSWLPGRARTTGEAAVTSQTIPEMSNTRSSFGRGISWQPPTTSTVSPATKAWRVTGAYSPSQTPWYPSRNNEQMMMDNAIDEPNQQGLESTSTLTSFSTVLLTLSLILLSFTR